MIRRGSRRAVIYAVEQAGRPKHLTVMGNALRKDIPDIGRVLAESGAEQWLVRLVKTVDRALVGEVAVQTIVNLEGNLINAGLRVTNGDLAAILRKSLQFMTSRGGGKFRRAVAGRGVGRDSKITQGYKNIFGGELRERVVQHLPNIRQRVDALSNEAREKVGEMIDTAVVGEVRLPNAPKSGKMPREGLLGPDRMIGVVKQDAAAKAEGFAGTLHVTAVLEVKAISGGLAGLDQLQTFIARASQNILEISGKKFRIKFDERTLKRLLILPENAKDMKAIKAFAKDQNIELLPYSKAIEKAIDEQVELAVRSLLQLHSLLG